MKKALLTVAGFDPSSGAGATLDLKVFHHFGFYGLAVLTSVTVQDSRCVYDHRSLPPAFVLQQYRKLNRDFDLAGIKIGMLGSQKIIPVLQELLKDSRKIPVVVDPVFRSSSGRWLLEKQSLKRFLKSIRGKITLITPNLNEASLVLGKKIDSSEKMPEAARQISQITSSACLIKGGHLSDRVIDLLFDGQRVFKIKKEKLPVEVHGTGCFLSSAILCFLAEGRSLPEACRRASKALHHLLKSPLRISGRALFDL